jgi:transaldolase
LFRFAASGRRVPDLSSRKPKLERIAMSLKSLIATGTKVWVDGVEPEDVKKNRAAGATGATSNPIIIS